MDLPAPPSQAVNALFNREQWTAFVEEHVLLWEGRLDDLGPEELRKSRDYLQDRVERWEEKAEDVLEKAGSLAREIASYADLEEEESVRKLRLLVKGVVPRKVPREPGGELVDKWERWKVFSEAAPGDQKGIERLARCYSRFREEAQRERFSLRVVEHVYGRYLNGSLKLNAGEQHTGQGTPPEQDQRLTTILTDSERRLEWIGEELMSRGETWEERYRELEKICERVGVSMPYSNSESLRKSFNQSHYG